MRPDTFDPAMHVRLGGMLQRPACCAPPVRLCVWDADVIYSEGDFESAPPNHASKQTQVLRDWPAKAIPNLPGLLSFVLAPDGSQAHHTAQLHERSTRPFRL